MLGNINPWMRRDMCLRGQLEVGRRAGVVAFCTVAYLSKRIVIRWFIITASAIVVRALSGRLNTRKTRKLAEKVFSMRQDWTVRAK